MSSTKTDHSIPLAYRIVFLYIEPLLALLGACQALLDPATLLSMQTPNAAVHYRPELRPITTQIAGGWFFLAFNDVVLLRLFPQDTKVWRCVLAGGLLSDAVYVSSLIMDLGFARFFNPWLWTGADAGTIISTLIPMALKVTGSLGLGMRTTNVAKITKKSQ